MNPDPSVVRVGNNYYLATSSFEYFPSCPIYHSLDLVHWQRAGYALSTREQFQTLGDEHPSTYACTLRFHAGKFYALTTDVRGRGNFLVSATDPAGPWSTPVLIDKGMFDPSLFFDDDGKVFYTRRGPDPEHGIVQAEIDVNTGKLLTPLRTVGAGMLTPDAEGPHLYKIDGWYYLSLAEGGSRFLHMETIGRSHSPWGPFAPDPANPWVSQHTGWDYRVRTLGHCDLVDTPQHDWWTACLGTRHFNYAYFSLGRETFLFHVDWVDGWPHVRDEDEQHLHVDHAPPAEHSFPEPAVREDFSERALSSEWNTFGPAGWQLFSLSERPGYLRLHGQPDGLSFAHASAFVGRRQTEWKTSATAQIEFSPQAEGDLAGLTVFMSPAFHYDLVLTRREGKRVLELQKHVGDMTESSAPTEVPVGPLQLRIDSDAETYTFRWSSDGKTWQTLGTAMEKLIASEIANVWSGAYIGMFSQTKHDGPPADFRWFDYTSAEQPSRR